MGFWRMVRVRVELVRKSRIPTHPRGGAGFHGFLHMPPLLTWSPELPGPLPSCSRCGEGSYVHWDRTLRLEFVRSWKETGILGKAHLLSSPISSSECWRQIHTPCPPHSVVAGVNHPALVCTYLMGGNSAEVMFVLNFHSSVWNLVPILQRGS